MADCDERDEETGRRSSGMRVRSSSGWRNQVKTGQIGLLDSFTQAVDDPNMLALLADQIKQAGGVDAAKELMSEGELEAVFEGEWGAGGAEPRGCDGSVRVGIFSGAE